MGDNMAYYLKRALILALVLILTGGAVLGIARLEADRHEATARVSLTNEVFFYDVEQEREARAESYRTDQFRNALDAVVDTSALVSLTAATEVRTDFIDLIVESDDPAAAVSIATAAAELAAASSLEERLAELEPSIDRLQATQGDLQIEIDDLEDQIQPLREREGQLAVAEAELQRSPSIDVVSALAGVRIERGELNDQIGVLTRERNLKLDLQDRADAEIFTLTRTIGDATGAVEVSIRPEAATQRAPTQNRLVIALTLVAIGAIAAMVIEARHFGPIRSARSLRTNFAPVRIRDWREGEGLDDVFVRPPSSTSPVSAACPAVIGLDGAQSRSVAKQMSVGWSNGGLDAVLADVETDSPDLLSMKHEHDVVVLDFGDLTGLDRTMRSKLPLATEIALVVESRVTTHRAVRNLINAFEQRGLPVHEIVLGPPDT